LDSFKKLKNNSCADNFGFTMTYIITYALDNIINTLGPPFHYKYNAIYLFDFFDRNSTESAVHFENLEKYLVFYNRNAAG